MTPEKRRAYRQGRCDAMALALHRLTSLPLVKIVGLRRGRGSTWCEEPAHLAVKAGRHWLDVDGLHQGVPKDRLTWLHQPEKIAIRPSSVEEASNVYALKGVPEREIQNAMKDALGDPKLRELISHFRMPQRSRRTAAPGY